MKSLSHEREDARVSIVVLTFNRRARVLSLLRRLQDLHGDWPVIVVDNGSEDGTAAAVSADFPSVLLIRARRNLGAAARNIGAAYVHTPYIAFCDDHVQWDPDALERGVSLLDASPDIAVLSTSVRSGVDMGVDYAHGVEGECCDADAPLGSTFQNFLAGACIVRTRAFCEVGGYWPPLFSGGEETLMALDLAERGWRIVYAGDVIARTLTSASQHDASADCLVSRNLVWVAWMRLPARIAWRITLQQLDRARQRGHLWRTTIGVLMGLPKVLNRRHVVSVAVQRLRPLFNF